MEGNGGIGEREAVGGRMSGCGFKRKRWRLVSKLVCRGGNGGGSHVFACIFLSLSLSPLESVSKVVGEGETLGEKGSWRVSKDGGRDFCGK